MISDAGAIGDSRHSTMMSKKSKRHQFADKTSNLYEVPPEPYKKFRKENVTKTYKKANDHLYNQINEEAKSIASNLGLDN